MKKLSLIVLLAFLSAAGFCETTPKKIKIILLGTFHFNQSLDSTSRLHLDLFSDKRQKEVNELVDKLVKQKPDEIFLEFTQKNQLFYDSIYTDYLKGREPQRISTKANEFFQLGMKTAKRLGHKRVIGVNYQPLELADSTYKPKNLVDKAVQDLYIALHDFNDSTRTNADFYDLPFPLRLPKQDSLLQKSTLTQFLLYLNSSNKLQRDDYDNWNYFYSMGTGNDMSSTDYVGTFWYGTNVRNYNNVLRQVDFKKDKVYLLIYGSSHVPFLRHLFEMNPYFEVINLSDILQ